jgi:ribose transport system substrate-binding protein
MKIKMFVLLTLILALGVFTFVGCSQNKDVSQNQSESAEGTDEGQQTKSSDPVTIMFDCPKVNDPVWLIAKAGFEAAGEELGFKAVWTGADDHSVERTVEAIENTISVAPDGIVCCPFSPTAFTNVLENAMSKGIKVTTVCVDAESKDLRHAFVGTNSIACGTSQMEAIVSQLGTDTEIVMGVIMSNVDAANQIKQLEGAEMYLKENNIKYRIVDTQADFADPVKSLEIVSTMVKAHPDMNAIFSGESGGTPGVGKALDDLGVTDKIVAVCMDDTDLNLDTIRNGHIYAVAAQDFFEMGYLGGQFCYEAIMGKEVPSNTDSGVCIVTRDNVDNYQHKSEYAEVDAAR